MGIISRFFLGSHLTKLATIFEEGVAASDQHHFDPTEVDGFSCLSATRQSEIKLDLAKRTAALRSYPRHVITRELMKNGILASNLGRQQRVLAYINLYDYLLAQGVALDMDTFNASYGV